MGARRFSIITVSYNAAGAIGRTARSVIGQKFRDFEYLVVDGASSDGTPQEALEATKGSNDIDVNIVSEPDNGLYDAMNKGIDRATGDYLIFLNAGDTFHSSDTLSILNKAIEDNDFPGIVYGQTDIVDSPGQGLYRRLTPPIGFRQIMNGVYVACSIPAEMYMSTAHLWIILPKG